MGVVHGWEFEGTPWHEVFKGQGCYCVASTFAEGSRDRITKTN